MIYTSVKPKSAKKKVDINWIFGMSSLQFWFFYVGFTCCTSADSTENVVVSLPRTSKWKLHFAVKSHANFLLSKKFAINENWIPSDPFSHVCFTILLMETYHWSVDEKLASPSLCCTCKVQFESFQTGDDWCKKHHSYLTFGRSALWWFETGSQQSSQMDSMGGVAVFSTFDVFWRCFSGKQSLFWLLKSRNCRSQEASLTSKHILQPNFALGSWSSSHVSRCSEPRLRKLVGWWSFASLFSAASAMHFSCLTMECLAFIASAVANKIWFEGLVWQSLQIHRVWVTPRESMHKGVWP